MLIRVFLENLKKLGHVKPRNYLAGLGRRWIDKESKKDQFVTATAISERANANLGIKISRLNEINFNSRVASVKPYISKKNKINRLKFATKHI